MVVKWETSWVECQGHSKVVCGHCLALFRFHSKVTRTEVEIKGISPPTVLVQTVHRAPVDFQPRPIADIFSTTMNCSSRGSAALSTLPTYSKERGELRNFFQKEALNHFWFSECCVSAAFIETIQRSRHAMFFQFLHHVSLMDWLAASKTFLSSLFQELGWADRCLAHLRPTVFSADL